MIQAFIALCAGAVFGLGLALSGMTDPAKVRGFLDLFGTWDPTLAFVMGGALLPMGLAQWLSLRRSKPLADGSFHRPKAQGIDARLIGGAALFGIGWGLAGLCPGPGLASLALAPLPAFAFCAAMLAGMAVYRLVFRAG